MSTPAIERSGGQGAENSGPELALGRIFSGGDAREGQAEAAEVRVRIISHAGVPRWVLPEQTRRAVTVLRSWKPYKVTSRLKWGAVVAACRMNAGALLPGLTQAALRCDLSYWREQIPEFSGSWAIVAYIGNASPTRKALLFFVDANASVRAVAKVPITGAAKAAILNEARVLKKLQRRFPVPEVLFFDEREGIAAQSWIEGTNVARKFGAEELDLLTAFGSDGARVRLSNCYAGLQERIASLRSPVDSTLLKRALLLLEPKDELRACLEHGDFAPWNLRRLVDGRLSLIDWEWAVEEGFPWQDVCRYFYMQDYLFRERADVWKSLMTNPLLGEYRRRFDLSVDAVRGLTARYLLRFLCDEDAEGNREPVEYAARKLEEMVEAGP